MENCIFCKIINRELPSEIVFESENILAFKDINPQAPLHIQIIPKSHIPTLNDLAPTQTTLLGEMVLTAKTLAKQLGVADPGYRIAMNCNQHGGQEVFHIHLHLLAGRQLAWPPG